jgi:hypothetical protein
VTWGGTREGPLSWGFSSWSNLVATPRFSSHAEYSRDHWRAEDYNHLASIRPRTEGALGSLGVDPCSFRILSRNEVGFVPLVGAPSSVPPGVREFT